MGFGLGLHGYLTFCTLLVLLMSETAHSKKQGSHDDCEDCKREKKQNQAFIAIYEKLQNIEKKSLQIKNAVNKHKAISETNRSFYKSTEKKLVSLPKLRERDDTHTMEKVGFEIAAGLVEKQVRSKVYAENLRLKEIINSMQKDKMKQSQRIQQQNLTASSNNPGNTPSANAKMSQSFNSTLSSNLPNSNTYDAIESLEKLMTSQDGSETENQNNITQSTSFKSTSMKKQMDLSRYGDMNLWLYQQEKHAKLEEELYLTKTPRNKSLSRKPAAAYLPTIRVQK